MKYFVVFSLVLSLAVVRGDNVLDILMDNWLGHAREMMDTTQGQIGLTRGFAVKKEVIFIGPEEGNLTAAVGIISDLSSIERNSSVSLTLSSATTADAEFVLTFGALKVRFPTVTLMIQNAMSEGASILEDMDLTPADMLQFKVQMSLVYSEKSSPCQTLLKNVTVMNSPDILMTVANPPQSNRIKGDTSKAQLMTTHITEPAIRHITSLINYEDVCNKFLNLF